MPTGYKQKATQYGAGEAPPAGVQAADRRTAIARKFKKYTQGDDAEQFDNIRETLSQINFYLSEETLALAKGQSQLDVSKLVSMCTALGISYDKLYSKRDPGIRPLSFPDPLLKMVKKGLELSNSPAGVKAPEVSASGTEVSPPAEPASPSRYKTPMMQQAHEALCGGVSIEPKVKGVNPRAEYRKQWEQKRKQKQAEPMSGGEACAGMDVQGGGLSPQAVAQTNADNI